MAKRPVLVLGAATIVFCSTPTVPCACPPTRTHLIVYGTVRTSAGAPVADARVFVTPAPAGAPSYDPILIGQPPAASTGMNGGYRIDAFSGFGPTAPALVRAASIRAPADTARAEATGASLRSERERPDSLQLDIVFP